MYTQSWIFHLENLENEDKSNHQYFKEIKKKEIKIQKLIWIEE